MKTIYRYPFQIEDTITLRMKNGAEILCVDSKGGVEPSIWAAVDTAANDELVTFELRGTGHSFNGQEGRYLGTFQMAGGALVFHLFFPAAKALHNAPSSGEEEG